MDIKDSTTLPARDSKGHFIPSPTSPKVRIAALEAQVTTLTDKLGIAQMMQRNAQDELNNMAAQVVKIQEAKENLWSDYSDLKAENANLRTQLTQAADALKQEQNASRGGMVIALTVGMIFSAVIAFLVGRYGR